MIYIITNFDNTYPGYILEGINNKSEIRIIPKRFTFPTSKYLQITRCLFVGRAVKLPLRILSIWFDPDVLKLIAAINPDDHLVLDGVSNPRICKMIKDIAPRGVVIYNYFSNPISSVYHNNARNIIQAIKDLGIIVYTFDSNDADKYGIKRYKQFLRFPDYVDIGRMEYDFFFCGLPKDREKELSSLKEYLCSKGYKCMFITPKDKSELIPYTKYLDYIRKSRCLIDISQKAQAGLTRRPLEALFFEKKLLTYNPMVKEEDFYNGNNINILVNSSYDTIDEFMKKPLADIPHDIKQRYDVNEWIKLFR